MLIAQAFAAAIGALRTGFLRRLTRGLDKLGAHPTALPVRGAAPRSGPLPDWYRFPPF